MDGLELDSELVDMYDKIITNINIKQSERSDRLIWAGAKDEIYSVKQGYKVIIYSQQWNSIEIPLKL